jgi:hypothetical protein
MYFLGPAELRALDRAALEDLLGRSEMIIAAGDGEVRGISAAALLFSDLAVLDAGASLHLDTSEAWAGAAWRLGRRALMLSIASRATFSAADAKSEGLCDDISDTEPDAWLERWMQGRSALALDSAAALIRFRGGDALERAEFARLFAIGEPQRGLEAFLSRRRS